MVLINNKMSNSDQLKELNNIINKTNNVNYESLESYKKDIINKLKQKFNSLNMELVNYNLSKCFKCVFIKNKNYQGKIIYDKEKIEIPNKFKRIAKKVNKIATYPQPVQRSHEWFEMRKNMLTASTAAQTIGECKYGKADDVILDKIGYGKKFKDNKFVHHGKKYEEVATKIYEQMYDVKVDEYGLIPHLPKPRISFLGASPDGIASHYKLDNSFSDMVGRMLEIKCPYSRSIVTEGKINGEICPHHYWCQVQQQLECCNLKHCDFWQCNLKEYYDKDEWLQDVEPTKSTEEQNQEKHIPTNCQRGMIIQLLPKNKITEFCMFDAKYIYPDDINMDLYNYDKWVLDTITTLHRDRRDLMRDYVFDRVLYWKLVNSHNVVIKRDKKWFKETLPKFEEVWNKILYYRKNKIEAKKFADSKVRKKPKIHISTETFKVCIDSDED